ncbi:unnamed protein product [Rotaria magnacalcarata]|uniref:Uncharacterized protein n=1 Tax=Rotaria magnacalcarata TaxID=392030 RepID=A0A816ZHR9_9BILA|nr:unnamed protein product [Rotaria magnacalcarata]CAF1437664.1 unnamed protein product [Rotaria magnacalcarata]CAF2031229.1 unnamed protein product [Rotaria magnacalcarata]CAF2111957.1 unnamed protein product [Rotaria magnacalcarata]CAF2207382.1 unnamed protein product [Rotaria magnacalcarata]
MVESQVFFKWLSIAVVPLLIFVILGLSYWIFAHQRRKNQKSNENQLENELIITKPIHQNMVSKNEYLSSQTQILAKKSKSTNSTQFTNTDIADIDKILHTASDRAMWKRNYLTKNRLNKLKQVPSEQTRQKSLFIN